MKFEGVYPAIITPLEETNKFKEEEIYSNFKASNGWYFHFKKKYNLSLKNITSKPFKLKPGTKFQTIKQKIKEYYQEFD